MCVGGTCMQVAMPTFVNLQSTFDILQPLCLHLDVEACLFMHGGDTLCQ